MRLMILLLVAAAAAAVQEPVRFTRWVWDGVYTSEQASRGRALYGKYCAECHGPDLLGRSDVPPPPPPFPGMIIRPGSPALRGADFVSNWNDLSAGNIWERIRISMPQNAPGSLSRQQNADILAYILQENGYPTGVGELQPDKTELDTIRISR
jgi:mono/diheme cytochrome c family protein